MFRLIKPGDFLAALSRSPRLKFILAWATFGGLVIPSAVLMSLGVSEKYVLPLMVAAILPFQYAAFCVFNALISNPRIAAEPRARTFPLLFDDLNQYDLRRTSAEAERIRSQSEQFLLRTVVLTRSESDHVLSETCMQFSAGSYFKGTAVVLPATSVDTNALLNFTDAQTKTLVEMIELQRKSLNAARREEPALAPKMLLSGIPQHG